MTEPGADASQRNDWEGKLVFVEGVNDIAEALQLYTSNEYARRQQHLISWNHARKHYKLEDYLAEVL